MSEIRKGILEDQLQLLTGLLDERESELEEERHQHAVDREAACSMYSVIAEIGEILGIDSRSPNCQDVVNRARHIAEAVAAEREACAKVCDDAATDFASYDPPGDIPRAFVRERISVAHTCARAIRARKCEGRLEGNMRTLRVSSEYKGVFLSEDGTEIRSDPEHEAIAREFQQRPDLFVVMGRGLLPAPHTGEQDVSGCLRGKTG